MDKAILYKVVIFLKKYLITFAFLCIITVALWSCSSKENEQDQLLIYDSEQMQLYESVNIQTQINDCAVFIDEQPIFAYFYANSYYVSVDNLENYGFDLTNKDDGIYLIHNADKIIEFAPKDLINRKKDDDLFKTVYPAFESNESVHINKKLTTSLLINGQVCIDINDLSDYAIISFDENKKIIKLDYKKKEFETRMKNMQTQTIEYPDNESSRETYRIVRLLLGRYTGEVSKNMRNGFGVLEFNYIDRGNSEKIDSITTGYWENNLANGFQIYEHWEEKNTWGWIADFDINYIDTPKDIRRYRMRRTDNKSGIFLNIYIIYDELVELNYSGNRDEGFYYDEGYDGLYRVSKIDDSYKYGYYVVSDTMWDKGDIALSKEEILAKYNEINPPLNEEQIEQQIKELDANIEADLPTTLEECYIWLEKELKPEDVELIKSGTEDDLGQYYYGLGTWIRNMWLWHENSGVYKYFVLNGITHPDDISGIIIPGFYHYLNGNDFDIEEYFYEHKKSTVISYLIYFDNQREIIGNINDYD